MAPVQECTEESTSELLMFPAADASPQQGEDRFIDETDGLLPSLPRQPLKPEASENKVHEPPTAHVQETPDQPRPLVRYSDCRPTQRRFKMLQHWEGIITAVQEEFFWANLSDLSAPSNPEEVVELPIEEISESDRPLLKPGSVFYWSIGHEITRTGQIRRVSEIRLQRVATHPRRDQDESTRTPETIQRQ